LAWHIALPHLSCARARCAATSSHRALSPLLSALRRIAPPPSCRNIFTAMPRASLSLIIAAARHAPRASLAHASITQCGIAEGVKQNDEACVARRRQQWHIGIAYRIAVINGASRSIGVYGETK
jgi:hypothetical protein